MHVKKTISMMSSATILHRVLLCQQQLEKAMLRPIPQLNPPTKCVPEEQCLKQKPPQKTNFQC